MRSRMEQLGQSEKPRPELVHALEALLILLSPEQRFNGPTETTSAITWCVALRCVRCVRCVRRVRCVRHLDAHAM